MFCRCAHRCLCFQCEDKQFTVSWDVKGMLVALTRAVRQPYFPASVRNTLQTFLSR